MRAGMLRHKIAIQKPSTATSRDSYGAEVVAWSTDSQPYASIMPLRGSEYLAAQQVQSSVTHKIRIRYQTLVGGTRIHPRCRIRFGTRYFNIQDILKIDERDIFLDMMCMEDTST